MSVTARCGRTDSHGAHVIDRGESGDIHGWCAGNRDIVRARTMIRLDRTQWGAPMIRSEDGLRALIVETDRDYPGVASTFGWDISDVAAREGCVHDGTDGTVDCPGCGKVAADFIVAAHSYLDESIGATVDDPGYFTD